MSNWFYDLSAGYGRNKFDFYVTDSLNTSLGPTLATNQTRFYSGSLGRQPAHDEPRRLAAVQGRVDVRSAERRVRRGVAARRIPASRRASRTRTSTAAFKDRNGAVAPVGRAGLPRLPAVERGRRHAQQQSGVRRSRRRRPAAAPPRRGRPLRELQRLRQHDERQGHRALLADEAAHLPRLGEHRLPRAVAEPGQLLGDQHELPAQYRPRVWSSRSRPAPTASTARSPAPSARRI